MEANLIAQEADAVFFDGRYDLAHRPIRDALFQEIFDPETGRRSSSRTELTYRRALAIRDSVGDLARHVEEPEGLFALAEWVPLLDIDLFSILVVHYNLGLGTLIDLGGSAPELELARERFGRLEAFMVYMATEVGYGNNLAALRTEARYDRRTRTFAINTPELSARKFMSTAGSSSFPKSAIVLARLLVDDQDHGVFPFLVDLASQTGPMPGVYVEPVGHRPGQFTDMATSWFTDARVDKGRLLCDRTAVLGDDGEFVPIIKNPRARFLRAASRLLHGRLCVASAAAGVSRASIFLAATYSEERMTNAPGRKAAAVSDYLLHGREICIALARSVAVTALVNSVRRKFHPQAKDASLDVSLCKVFATVEAMNVVLSCRERCGAQGTLSRNRIADFVPFIDGMRTAEGDNLVLSAGAISQILSKQPTAQPAPPSFSGHPFTFSTLKVVLEARYASLWRKVSDDYEVARVKQPVFDAWNAVSTQGVRLCRLRSVVAACAEMLDMARRSSRLREPLLLLGEIFTMTELLEHQGWCVSHGVSTSDPSQEFERRIDGACASLRPHIKTVISEFGLSPELLRSPLAETQNRVPAEMAAGCR